MKIQTWRLGLLAAALPILWTAGCPGTDPLTPSTSDVRVTLVFENLDSGSARPFFDDLVGDAGNFIPADGGFGNLNSIRVRPLDPEAQAASTSDLGIVDIAQDFEFSGNGFAIQAPLRTGGYSVQRVSVNSLTFFDNSDGMGGRGVNPAYFSDPMNPTCRDFVQLVELAEMANDPVPFTLFSGDPVFPSTPGTIEETNIRVDVAAMIDALKAAHSTCFCPNNCVANYDFNNPATYDCACFLDGLVRLNFRNASASFLTIE